MHRQFLEQNFPSRLAPTLVPSKKLTFTESLLSLSQTIQRLLHADHALLLFTHTLAADLPYDYVLFFHPRHHQLYTFEASSPLLEAQRARILLEDACSVMDDARGFGAMRYLVINELV